MSRTGLAWFTLLVAGCSLDFDHIKGVSAMRPGQGGLQPNGIDSGAPGSTNLPGSGGTAGSSNGQTTGDAGMHSGSTTHMDASATGGGSGGRRGGMDAGNNNNDAGASDTGTDAGVDADVPLACATNQTTASSGMIASVDTSNASDTLQGSCGGSGSPDVVVDWRVPQTDFWVLDTKGSAFDTVLYANGNQCTNDELACNNNLSPQSSQSEIVSRFTKGEHVGVVIDGNAGAKGAAVLNASRVTCPTVDLDLSGLPSTFVDQGNDQTESFRFTAPQAGFYSFRAQTGKDVTLDLISGARCGGDLIGANTGSGFYGAEVIRTLTAGQVVTLTVLPADNTVSTFTLDIAQPLGLVCPTEDLFNHVNVDETLPADAPHLLTASCAQPGDPSQALFGFGAVAFHVHVDGAKTTQYSIGVTSGFQSAVYMLNGDCGGSEYSCTLASYDSTSMRYAAYAGISASPDPQDFVFVIQNVDQNTGGPKDLKYQIQITIQQ